jgi:uncharacterized protein YfaS (alpha-2-macroglobulin family)
MSTSAEIIRGETIKSGDTLPELRVQLTEKGNAFNLDSYSVEMKMKRAGDDSLAVDASVSVEQPNRGIVTYSWSTGDTDTAGTYELEFTADDGSGSTLTFPNSGTEKLYIEEELN